MKLDQESVLKSFEFDSNSVEKLKSDWLQLMNLAVWGDLHLSKLGALPRLRKRILEVGENLNSTLADRQWIPHPREQLKSALGSTIKLRDSLQALERSAVLLSGGKDFQEFETSLLAFRQQLLVLLERHEGIWAGLLDTQYDEDE